MGRLTVGPTAGLRLTTRDEQLLHASWSLGAATADVLRRLVSPTTSTQTLRSRLRRLRQAGYLTHTTYVTSVGGLCLYQPGPASRVPDDSASWQPSLAQLQHTLLVGDVLAALVCHARSATQGLAVDWQGEGELRAWATSADQPFPDAAVSGDGGQWRWQVEVDRATQTRSAWRRKLLRYLRHQQPNEVVLAVTTSRARASHLAQLALDVGVPMLATTSRDVMGGDSLPDVLDTRLRRQRPLLPHTSGRTPAK